MYSSQQPCEQFPSDEWGDWTTEQRSHPLKVTGLGCGRDKSWILDPILKPPPKPSALFFLGSPWMGPRGKPTVIESCFVSLKKHVIAFSLLFERMPCSTCQCHHFTVGQPCRRLARWTCPKSHTYRVTEVDFDLKSFYVKKKKKKAKKKKKKPKLSWEKGREEKTTYAC